MKKSSSTIVIGLFFILTFFVDLNSSTPGFNSLNPFFGVFGFIQLLTGIFDRKEYYNKSIYLTVITVVSAAILILSYFQASSAYYGAINSFYVIAGIVIVGIIGATYEFTRKMEKYHKTVKTYTKALEINPKDFKAWTNKGNALIAVKEYDKALESYNKALKINPTYPTAWFHKGSVLTELRKYHDAIEAYDKTIELDQKDVKAWNNKGYVLMIVSNYQESIDCFDKALEIDPKFSIAWFNKGIALTEVKEYEKALESYNKAVEIDPKDVRAWHNRGIVLKKLGRDQEALQSHEKALELDPDFEPAKNKLKKRWHFLNLK